MKTQVGYLRHEKGRELTYALMGNGLAPGRKFWSRLEKLLAEVRGYAVERLAFLESEMSYRPT